MCDFFMRFGRGLQTGGMVKNLHEQRIRMIFFIIGKSSKSLDTRSSYRIWLYFLLRWHNWHIGIKISNICYKESIMLNIFNFKLAKFSNKVEVIFLARQSRKYCKPTYQYLQLRKPLKLE